MTKHKSTRASTRLLQKIVNLHKTMTTQDIHWFLRGFLASSRQQMQAGFVLPTTVLVLLVVGLTVTALLFRSFSRTSQVIGQREQQKIYNAATPTIDRAKAKLENLFGDNLPAGVPPEKFLVGKMSELDVPDDKKVYSLPGETRLDLNGDGTLDNAWRYQDSTGNTVVYSILMNTQGQDSNDNKVTYIHKDLYKAAALVVRNGPVNTAQLTPACQIQNNQGDAAVENGWFRDASSSAFLRKNFQINAVVLSTNSNAPTKAVATLELQQERQVDRGNKWGVWFRNDLEIFPAPPFKWNGSMHTEGSVFLGSANFNSYLISSPSSCLYGIDGIEPSQISINQQVDENQQITFQGQVVSGKINDNMFLPDSSTIDRASNLQTQLHSSNDSVINTGTLRPIQIALDPLAIFTENKSRSRNARDLTNTTIRDTKHWDDSNPLATGDTRRVFNKQVPIPYLDDTYRADNLYGPKLPPDGLPTNGKKAGSLVETTDVNVKGEPLYSKLVSNDPPADNPELLGLDGYWERRARLTGLRVLVGQRLELGDPLPLPDTAAFPSTFTRQHEALQRRTLRDNLAAVQATAIYHYENDPNNLDSPIACVATTAHPGTATTQRNSATFEDITFTKAGGLTDETLRSDFFTGRGTNGWEYDVPNAATFPNASMLRALRNLANFAGDPFGAFPARQDSATSQAVSVAGQKTHPYPELTRHGNFSNLRRALANLDANGNVYSNLSIADKSYLQTAACSLGMLANNIMVLQDFSYPSSTISSENGTTNLSALNLALASVSGRSPEEVIANMPGSMPTGTVAQRRLVRLARLVYLKEQVEWDRLAPEIPNPLCTSLIAYGANLSKLCPTVQTPSSALYYIFPIIAHPEVRADIYINSASVNPTSITNLYRASDNTALENIRLKPKTSISTWALNTVNVTTNTDPLNTSTSYGTNTNVPNHRQESLIRYQPITGTSTVHRVPFKDTAPFNGREMMSVRVLNIDLDLLRRDNVINDSWLPVSGLIYAFREDAVREDAIARPEIAAWNTYRTAWNANLASGPLLAQRMNASPNSPKDPPLNADTGLSPKPIDYYPDPDRRPYGFRLKNGKDLSRTNANNTFGLSFISDNPVYIQGDFNLHRNSSNQTLEEFAQHLVVSDWNNFYTRSTLAPQFARAADRWRPSEIVADAVTILSDNFCDGSIEDGFTQTSTTNAASNTPSVPLAKYGCGTNNDVTSYLNQNRPSSAVSDWLRETIGDETTPIKVSQNGAPSTSSTTPYNNNNYQNFANSKRRNEARETRVNAIIVSGLVPSRVQQSYGGLHNFPRFLEDWKNGGVNLHISGSFIQLNFSSYATGPFDQDAWESSQLPTGGPEYVSYYQPPARRWGYDVGLQYQPSSSVSRRFTTPSTTRNEFYKELSLDDPYISMLRCATNEDGEQVDPNLSCP